MSICLLLIDDGREDYYERCLASLERVTGIDYRIEVFDTEHVLGFAGAIRRGWELVAATNAAHCFHVESDFTFNEDIDLRELVALLERHPHLAQVSLKRQAVNPREIEAGGIVEANPDDFIERSDAEAVWTEHRRYWTTNPSVYSTELCEGWPMARHSEGKFTHRLLRKRPETRFAIWGAKFDPPLVTHIGEERAGHGY